ncbi:MAG: aldose epimerase family protein [Thermoguttaceae bacterium]
MLEKEAWGVSRSGEPVDRYTLKNAGGAMVRILTLGATVSELWMPDRTGKLSDVVLGFDDPQQYDADNTYFGCLVGRVAFRITGAQFTLDGQPHHLVKNKGEHHMHGGEVGFNRRIWTAEPVSDGPSPAVRMTLHSPDGDQGYPGNLHVAALFTLTDDNQLKIECTATTDRPTLINLTHHGYFNLAGAGCGDILNHVLQMDVDRWITPKTPGGPADTILPVADTPNDFSRPTAIGQRIHQISGGYDFCFLRRGNDDGQLRRVATLQEPNSGRSLDVLTNQPALVVYTGNYLNGRPGKQGAVYHKHAGVCLETGRPPEAIHYPEFPSVVLRPDETYRHTCIYRFSTCRC